jgi:hypothetical protein
LGDEEGEEDIDGVVIAPSNDAQRTKQAHEICKQDPKGIETAGIRNMQNEQPNEGGVPAENVIATLNYTGYFESQSKCIRECCHDATAQGDVAFPARSVAVTNWKSGDDDGAGAHVHEHAVHRKEPAHWLHPQATILEADYNATEAKANGNDIDWVY